MRNKIVKDNLPIMPKSTAIWLVDNTNLTFSQIAEFCGITELEVQAIADGEVDHNIPGADPIMNGNITQEEIDRCSADPTASLKLKQNPDYNVILKKKKKESIYTPVARRQDKPDAICWLLKNIPDIKDSEIVSLIGTTKQTILSVKERSHWNIENIKPRDPVLLGICTQAEIGKMMEISQKRTLAKEQETNHISESDKNNNANVNEK